MKKKIILTVAVVLCSLVTIGFMMGVFRNNTLYLDSTLPVDQRVENLLPQLTLQEKVSLCHGNSKFTISGLPRFNIPELTMSDGPCGVREDCLRDAWGSAGRTDDSSTALPSQVVLACTWNKQLALQQGIVLGAEARYRNKDVILAPGVNIMRTPLCGRNFEYLGEDPFLTSRMAVNLIRGIQSQGTAACVKHFLANNQEYQRNTINVEMDERTLHEIYLPAFRAAVEEAGVMCVMGAYNKFRGQHCCHHKYLLQDLLKGEMNFGGVVISDWDGCHSTDEAVLNGLDIEMGTEGGKKYNEYYLADPFLQGLKEGRYKESLLNEKVRRVLRLIFSTTMAGERPRGAFNTKEHQLHCLYVASEGIVLLKNDRHLLPLDSQRIKTVAVIGHNAFQRHAGGGGSAYIKALYEITPLEGLQRKYGKKITFHVAEGYSPDTTVDRKKLLREAVKAASASQVAIVFAGLTHVAKEENGRWTGWDNEGFDNRTWELPWGQYELIEAVRKANPRTIVVVIAGPAYSLAPFAGKVPALLYSSYAGMEAGNAIAAVLFGEVNPSGKLCFTYPVNLKDVPAHAQTSKEYPGEDGTVHYTEGIFTGYRWYESRNIKPLFCFGHGLSYTTFRYDSLVLSSPAINPNDTLMVSLKVLNSGTRDGAEVVQLYIHDEVSTVERPYKELKGFEKVFLRAGQAAKVTFNITAKELSFWDDRQKKFVAEKGYFKIFIGSSSQDIRLTGRFELKETAYISPSSAKLK